MSQRPFSFEPGEVIVGRAGLGRPLVGRAVDAEAGGEPVQFVDVVGKEVAPFEALPGPERIVHIDRHRFAPNLAALPSPPAAYSTQSAHFCTSSLPPQGITGTVEVEFFGEPSMSLSE